MMKNTLIVLILSAVALSSCAQKKLATKNQAKIPYIKMMRTPCFGRCPYYAIEVYDNGTVKYFGYMFTDHQGIYEYKPGKNVTTAMLNRFAAFRPDTCKTTYEVVIADFPGMNFTYTAANGDEKKIHNAHYGPAFLKAFAGTLDSAFTPNKVWKKLADTAILK